MKKALLVGALAVAGCSLVAMDLRAESASLPAESSASDTLIAELLDIVQQNPGAVATQVRLGYLLQEAGRVAEGQKWIENAREIDPTFFDNNDDVPTATPRMAPGQDVWVCSLPEFASWATVAIGGKRAYSIATTSANNGTSILSWNNSTQNYPVIAQNLYRYDGTRLEQVGMSWLKHGFCALQNGGCGSCMPAGGGCPPALGPGCADPYDSTLNGSQTRLGPHDQVNPTTGIKTALGTFPNGQGLPKHRAPVGDNTLRGRLQVDDADIDDATHLFLVEGQYIHPEDVNSGHMMNNASWRRVSFINGSQRLMSFVAGGAGSTRQMQQAIYAWQEFDPTVAIKDVDVPSDGRFTVAHKASNTRGATWRYEYAIHNMNSNRGAQSFEIPIPTGVNVTNIGFHDVPYHSGDGEGGVTYSGTDWTVTNSGGVLRWETQSHAANANANALRWGTMYNFWFEADSEPAEEVTATIGMFKPGTPTSAQVVVVGPGSSPCPWDLDGDGAVGSGDLAIILGDWATHGSGGLAAVLGSWGPCP